MSFTTDDLVNELQEIYPVLPERRPGGVTVYDMSRAWKIGYRHAYNRLRELESKGVLYSEICKGEHGRGVTVFYKKEV